VLDRQERRDRDYRLTERGVEELSGFGIDFEALSWRSASSSEPY
jgi:hypothetical protein